MDFSYLPYVNHSGLAQLASLSEWNDNVNNLVTILEIPEATFSDFFYKRQSNLGGRIAKSFRVCGTRPNEKENMLKIFFLTSAFEECQRKIGE